MKFLNLKDSEKSNWNWWQIIGWWELFRIPYNFILILSLSLTQYLIPKFVEVRDNEDVIEPFLILLFIILANFFYTFGWVVNLFYRFKRLNQKLLIIGTVFSNFVAILPIILQLFFYLKQLIFV